MKKILFIGLLALATSGAFAQAKYDIYARTIDINEKSLAFGLTEAQFESIKDDAYVHPKFVKGNIYQGDELIKTGVPMRLNAFADEIEIKKSPASEEFSGLVKDPSILVKMDDEVYVLIPYKGSNEKGGYFNVLYEGKKYDLYKKTTANFREGEKAKTTYSRDIQPAFIKSTSYFLVDNGQFLEIPSSPKKILKMMDYKKSEMKDYIKKNRLDLKKEDDLVKAISHFDSLQ